MKFRTEVDIPVSDFKIETNHAIFSIGSCFSTEISNLLADGQLQVFNNPFGTLFNPFSINNAIKKMHSGEKYTEEDLVLYKDEVHSLDHHSSFTAQFPHLALEKINSEIEKGKQFLQQANWVIITLGTSFIYEFLPKNVLVANCHKIPAKFFKKRLLTHVEICESISESISLLKDICKDNVQILYSISPVRHTKDGIIENTWSKSNLITALHQTIYAEKNVHYLPIYEIMMDDLRDYRFYKEDMIHPNSQAIHYIWEKFGDAYFSSQTKEFIAESLKIKQSLQHKPSDSKSIKYLEFQRNLEIKMKEHQAKVKHKIFNL
ncbi:GSCFA domain-containing protein [Frigoriflavimonas asaccharolytica]|uniref:GSCFA domain-containing protein n=1 Tax=Frigoriflavimonas asaccharolytica TaxID=2735899 RepID=A0A8J8K7X9_9FLAO|nr:GSCFA domain-containing protein [Frigoriflavimonas asaccharolytica]NRS92478.1 hypothetical protein [Frigoriflavimonas asaccharolytica]